MTRWEACRQRYTASRSSRRKILLLNRLLDGEAYASARIIRALDQIIEWRGRPAAIRCDNGPENISGLIQAWADRMGIRLDCIQPGKPQQNAYVERFNRTVRYEWLSQYYWGNLDEVQLFATQWMDHYNRHRPNMALGGFTPKQRLAMAAWFYF
jgi:putative transposase